jgi:hypothetical protein
MGNKSLTRIGEKHLTNEGYLIEIYEYLNGKKYNVIFSDGTTLENRDYSNIIKGKVAHPQHPNICGLGFSGKGIHKTSENRAPTKAYSAWKSAFDRCYREKNLVEKPTYRGCTVAIDWHNFQDFGDWFEINFKPDYMKGWCLDKDILFKGNKIYSPQTCAFVPNEINCLFIKNKNSMNCLPIGVSSTPEGRFRARLLRFGREVRLGNYTTPEEAFYAYKFAKESHIKEVAEIWKGLISDKVYEAMCKYKVEITD